MATGYTNAMEPGVDDLRHAVARFRRAHAQTYLSRIAGESEVDPRLQIDLEAACRGERLRAFAPLAGELTEGEHAALGAHLLRAVAERAYAEGRAAQAEVARWPARAGAEQRPLYAFWQDEASWHSAAGRDRLREALRSASRPLSDQLERARSNADAAVARALHTLSPGRHPDAGPDSGASEVSRQWLDASADLASEALATLGRAAGLSLRHEVDVLAALRGGSLRACAPAEGRAQRVGALWEPLGLRDPLNQKVRLGPAHRGLPPAAHVVVRESGARITIAPAMLDAGLLAELTSLEATGRALGHGLVSPALPVELRHPTVASVARSLGGVALGMALHPPFWARHYGASRTEARLLAQHAACYLLCESRLSAAAVLARQAPADVREELAREALTVDVAPEIVGVLLMRLSPGGSARGGCNAPALIAALREAFDEDWYRNPGAAEPLRGAAQRGGAMSVEQLVCELGGDLETGLSLLAELF